MRVLVVDESEAMRTALGDLLAGEGHDLVLAADGVSALTSVYRDGPDLVILDLQIPRLSGWVLCRMIKDDPATVGVPVVVLTDAVSAPGRFWAERSGADAILAKEDLGRDALDQIRSLLARRALTDLTGGVERLEISARDALARACEVLDHRLFETTVSAEMVAVGLRCGDVDEAMHGILEVLRAVVPFDVGAVGLLSQRRLGVVVARPVSEASVGVAVSFTVDALRRVSGTGITADDVEVVVLGPDPGPGPVVEWRSRLACPVQDRGRLLGVLAVACEEADRFAEQTLRTLRTISFPVAAVMASVGRRRAAASL